MKCPACGHPNSDIPRTRPAPDLERVRRRRQCLSCGYRWWTVEVAEDERVTLETLVRVILGRKRGPPMPAA